MSVLVKFFNWLLDLHTIRAGISGLDLTLTLAFVGSKSSYIGRRLDTIVGHVST